MVVSWSESSGTGFPSPCSLSASLQSCRDARTQWLVVRGATVVPGADELGECCTRHCRLPSQQGELHFVFPALLLICADHHGKTRCQRHTACDGWAGFQMLPARHLRELLLRWKTPHTSTAALCPGTTPVIYSQLPTMLLKWSLVLGPRVSNPQQRVDTGVVVGSQHTLCMRPSETVPWRTK